MAPSETPRFSFQRDGKIITSWFAPHPLKDSEGKTQSLYFRRECNSELEAALLLDYLADFQHLIRAHYFTEGYNAKKKKEQNYYL